MGQSQIYLDTLNLFSGHQMTFSTKLYGVGGRMGMRLALFDMVKGQHCYFLQGVCHGQPGGGPAGELSLARLLSS